MNTPVGLTGGCACGAVRYRLDASPFDAGYCHCTNRRRSSGAPVLAFASVPLALRIAWFDVTDTTPRHTGFRPDTRRIARPR